MTGAALTWQQLRDLDLSEIEDAGNGWNEVSARAGSDRDDTDGAMSAKLRETQESESARAAVGRLERLSRNFQYIHTEAGLISTALNGLTAELATPAKQLEQALRDAADLAFTVHQDGSVTYPAATTEGPLGPEDHAGGSARGTTRLPLDPHPLPLTPGRLAVPNPNTVKAQDIADRIARAVRSANEIDARYTRTLRRLEAAKGLDVTAATFTDVAQDTAAVRDTARRYLERGIPENESPVGRKTWWDGLTEEQRREYIEVAPDLVGYLDGIPAVARDEANRNYLPLLIDELERNGGDGAGAKLAALRGIEQKLGEPTRPPMYLLGIGAEGNGRAIVSYGNPDTARNVSAYVPGLSNRLDEEFVDGTMERALDTAKGARKYDASSAAIIWLGYDAPLSVDVASESSARKGAPLYNSFMSGLVATNEHKDPHFTAIGHSYGSFTVGTASQRDGGIPGADDIIVVGSPGTGVSRAEDLGVGKGHVFVGAAENDPVTHLPTKQEAGVGAVAANFGLPPAVVTKGLGFRSEDLYFGKDPASEAFGATRFQVDNGPRPVLDLGGFAAHGQYFTPERDDISADNIARIVAGKSEGIKEEAWR
ncbi:alpha/beta hydrolase [Streptomyces sp. NPDC093109]|uniref:alpha/beta hydrolase n=1 Tax=Streptomyces sp. NPDC093109 TaxID=3154977 RepID=UPI00344B8D55